MRSLTYEDALAPAAHLGFDSADPGDEFFSIAVSLIVLTKREHPERIPELIGAMERPQPAEIDEDELVSAYAD